MQICEICGGTNAVESIEIDKPFSEHVGCEVKLPVIDCPDCGLCSTDYRAEKIREQHRRVKYN